MPAARILGTSDEDVKRAAGLLQSGELVALPTETVYGLAGHAMDTVAVRHIFEVKGRPLIDPLIVHIHSHDQLGDLSPAISETARRLANAYWPGPLTLILPKLPAVPDLVTAGNLTIAVRMPAHPLTRRILQAADIPVAAPSANPFGYISPTQAAHVQASLGERIGWIVDGGSCEKGIESTIVDVTNEQPLIVRPGPVTPEMLAETLGLPEMPLQTSHAIATETMEAPGTLASHYSPHTPLVLLPHGGSPPQTATETGAAWISLARQKQPKGYVSYWLSEDGNLDDVARTLFAMLRKLDQAGHKKLFAELPPAEGIGLALCDRLTRAAAQTA